MPMPGELKTLHRAIRDLTMRGDDGQAHKVTEDVHTFQVYEWGGWSTPPQTDHTYRLSSTGDAVAPVADGTYKVVPSGMVLTLL